MIVPNIEQRLKFISEKTRKLIFERRNSQLRRLKIRSNEKAGGLKQREGPRQPGGVQSETSKRFALFIRASLFSDAIDPHVPGPVYRSRVFGTLYLISVAAVWRFRDAAASKHRDPDPTPRWMLGGGNRFNASRLEFQQQQRERYRASQISRLRLSYIV